MHASRQKDLQRQTQTQIETQTQTETQTGTETDIHTFTHLYACARTHIHTCIYIYDIHTYIHQFCMHGLKEKDMTL